MKTPEMHDWLKAGVFYRNKRDFEKALEAFAQARLMLLCEMGECLTSLGQLDEGRVVFEEVLEASPAHLRASAGVGLISLLAGDHKAAEAAFGTVLHGDPLDVKALCGMGLAKKGSGQLEEAYRLLKQVLEQDSDQKMALQALTEVAYHLSKTEDVLPFMRNYLSSHPDDADIAGDIKIFESLSTQDLPLTADRCA
jgi:tetratricopeptide (TPR) repeat protein